MVNTESRSAPHSTCNWRRMTTMARVKRFARRIKHKSVRLQTFRRCLPAQNQLADLSELPQHSATHHKHTHQVSIAQSMYPLDKSRFKWETTKVRLHLSAMLSGLGCCCCCCCFSYQKFYHQKMILGFAACEVVSVADAVKPIIAISTLNLCLSVCLSVSLSLVKF